MTHSTVTSHPAYDLAAIRAGIPILAHAIPMNNCSQAPLAEATRSAAEAFLESWNSRGMDWDRWIDEVARARGEFARLINASPDEVAAVTSVSHATSVIASALTYADNRRAIVVSEAEFPTVGHVWLAQERAGASVRWVPVRDGAVELEDYARLVDEQSVLVSATHAFYLNGLVQDVAAIARLAHERGALVYVDAYQSAGVVPIDVKAMDVDFLAAGTLKYLMGTSGLAFLYVRPDLIERLHPTVTGWFGRENPFAFDATRLDWSSTAARLEAGTPAVFSAYVSRAGMELLRTVGNAAVAEWCEALSRRLVEGGLNRGLTVHGPGTSRPKAPTTAFVTGRNSAAVESRLREVGVIASARGPVIRLAPHFYSTIGDVDRALDAVVESLAR
jgi:selenocysteine lyase/cysteine desulfurase